MALTKDQAQFVEKVRFSDEPTDMVCAAFEGVEARRYAERRFREWLFAIDATNRVASDNWYRVMVEGLARQGPWLSGGVLNLEALLEIEEHTRAHGVGEYAIELMVAMTEECRDLSKTAENVTRALLVAHFNGIQPVTGHALFVLKRFLEPRRPLVEQDMELVLHIIEETKGLDSASGSQRYMGSLLRQIIATKDGVDRRAHARLFVWLDERDEFCEAEIALAEMLTKMGLAVPKQVVDILPTLKNGDSYGAHAATAV